MRKDTWQDFWENTEEIHEKKSGRFAIKPVTPEVFFRDWLENPLFPRQQKAVNAAFNKNYTMLSDKYNEFVISWGKGCLHKDTPLKDEKTGEIKTVKEWSKEDKGLTIKTLYTEKDDKQGIFRNKTKTVKIDKPFKAGITELFKVKLKTGKEVIVSKDHLFKLKEGWVTLRDLNLGNKILVNDKPTLSVEAEISRRNKISKSLINKPKSKEHIQAFKTSINKGKFKKDNKPWNIGKVLPQKIKDIISKKLKGRKLSKLTRQRMSEANNGLKNHKSGCKCSCCKTRRGENSFFPRVCKYKDICMRSSWEVAFAKYLDTQQYHWLYEPKVFELSTRQTYTPDFFIIEKNEWIEIKGYYSEKNKQKINLFLKEYDINFKLLREEDLKKLGIL